MPAKKKPKVKSRTFQFVMFWDEVAWVAGCTDYYYVSQGQTPEQCVERLRDGLYLTAVFCERDGREPFDDSDRPDLVVPDDFTNTQDAVTFDHECAADKEKSYTGSVTVEWEEGENPKRRKQP